MFMSADDEPYLQLDKVGGAQSVGRNVLQHCVWYNAASSHARCRRFTGTLSRWATRMLRRVQHASLTSPSPLSQTSFLACDISFRFLFILLILSLRYRK